MNLVFKIIKRIIISSFLLYGYNILVTPLDLVIPINIYTILAISLLGIPALVALALILLFIY
ncbi:MAG: pro-sigmaK processing inhibitor BofA family protein [Bacilli bacterium]|nr:pro-sigmaK processing inhibitor BofA family protein [Bacilli bacterium]